MEWIREVYPKGIPSIHLSSLVILLRKGWRERNTRRVDTRAVSLPLTALDQTDDLPLYYILFIDSINTYTCPFIHVYMIFDLYSS